MAGLSRRFVVFAVTLPILAVAVGIASAQHRLARGQVWTFRVAGYDPRDLLRGHYIRYRLVYEEGSPLEACNPDAGQDCCLCLTRTDQATPPLVRRATCATAGVSCDGRLRMRHLSELRRYFIPEAGRRELEQRVRQAMRRGEATIDLSIDASGRPQVLTMRLQGEAVP